MVGPRSRASVGGARAKRRIAEAERSSYHRLGSSRNSLATRTWLEEHSRIRQRLHPRRRLMAQSPGRLVAHLPQDSPRRAILRRPRRHRLSHRTRNIPAQRPCRTVDMGQASTTNPTPTPTICVPPLRNPAVSIAAAALASGWWPPLGCGSYDEGGDVRVAMARASESSGVRSLLAAAGNIRSACQASAAVTSRRTMHPTNRASAC